jgi:hypothetical protein
MQPGLTAQPERVGHLGSRIQAAQIQIRVLVYYSVLGLPYSVWRPTTLPLPIRWGEGRGGETGRSKRSRCSKRTSQIVQVTFHRRPASGWPSSTWACLISWRPAQPGGLTEGSRRSFGGPGANDHRKTVRRDRTPEAVPESKIFPEPMSPCAKWPPARPSASGCGH